MSFKLFVRIFIVTVIFITGVYATYSYFSDSETSIGNIFRTGSVDLKIGNTAWYNGNPQGTSTWSERDLSSEKFFNLTDLMPGDWGKDSISLHVINTDSYACMTINNFHDNDDGLTSPEIKIGDSTNGADQGELKNDLHFYAWNDINNNALPDGGESWIFNNQFASADTVLNNKVYNLGTIIGNQVKYLGIYWCYGNITLTGNQFSCTGTGNYNRSQTDSIVADLSFYVEQTRNNANFICPGTQYSLIVNPHSYGTVSGTGISCGAAQTDCDESYAGNTVVNLSATPLSGYTFTGWSGDCSGTSACSLTMNGQKVVSANFTQNQPSVYQLTINKTGTGNGTVSSTPAGISCGTLCSAIFAANQQVDLSPTPDPVSAFTGWSGACTGTGSCTVAMNQAQSVTANFNKRIYSLSVSISGLGGKVTSIPVGIECGDGASICSANYDAGTAVTLTPKVVEGAAYHFLYWTGACSGGGGCTITMDAAKSLTATFGN